MSGVAFSSCLAVACFSILYGLLNWNIIGCIVLFFVGWGVITLFGQRHLKKVEAPDKKRYYLYGLLFPKKPRKK